MRVIRSYGWDFTGKIDKPLIFLCFLFLSEISRERRSRRRRRARAAPDSWDFVWKKATTTLFFSFGSPFGSSSETKEPFFFFSFSQHNYYYFLFSFIGFQLFNTLDNILKIGIFLTIIVSSNRKRNILSILVGFECCQVSILILDSHALFNIMQKNISLTIFLANHLFLFFAIWEIFTKPKIKKDTTISSKTQIPNPGKPRSN